MVRELSDRIVVGSFASQTNDYQIMKLHLPNGLRKALLACLAALSLSTALPVTVASGTVTLVFLSQQARAEFTGPTLPDGRSWGSPTQWSENMNITESTVVDMSMGLDLEETSSYDPTQDSRDNLVFDAGAENADLKLTWSGSADWGKDGTNYKYHADSEEFTFQRVGAFRNLWLDGHGHYIIDETTDFSDQIADIYISGARLSVDKESTWKVNIHIGTASGDKGGSVAAFSVSKNFTATGSLEVVEDATISFGNSNSDAGDVISADLTFSGIQGAGELTIGGSSKGTLTLTNGGKVGGISSSGSGADVTLGIQDGTTSLVATGDITLGGTLKVLGDVSITAGAMMGGVHIGKLDGTLKSLTLNGMILTVDSGSLSVGTLTSSVGFLILSVNVTNNETISIENLAGINEEYGYFELNISGLTDEQIGDDGYTLFTGNPEWLKELVEKDLVDDVKVPDSLSRPVELGADGVLRYKESKDVVWEAGADAEFEWKNKCVGWQDEQTFHHRDNVTMTATESGDKAVTVESVSVGNFTINGNGGIFTFSPAPVDGEGRDTRTITVYGKLHIEDGNTAVFGSRVQLLLEEDSSIEIGDGAELSVTTGYMYTDNKDGTPNHHRYDDDGWTNNHKNSPLSVNGSGTLTIDMSGDMGDVGVIFDGANIAFGAGIKLHVKGIEGEEAGRQNVRNLNNLGELELTGEGIVIQGVNTVGTLTVTDTAKLTFDNSPLSEDQSPSLAIENINLKERGTLKWSETNTGVTVSGGLQFNGGTFILQGGTLSTGVTVNSGGGTLQLNGGTFTATGWTGEGSLTGLVLAAGTTLDLGSLDAEFQFGAINLQGNANLKLGGSNYTQLLLGATGITSAEGAKLTITLTEAFLEYVYNEHQHTYQLFEGGQWGKQNVTFLTESDIYSVGWGENGYINVINNTVDNTWNIANGDNHWGTSHSNWGEDNNPWVDGSKAVFSKQGDKEGEEITIDGKVSPATMNVTSGTWTFTGGSLTPSGLVTVGSEGQEAHVTFGEIEGITLGGGLKLLGKGTTVTVGATTQNSGGLLQFGDIELGEGTELVLTGEQFGGTNAEHGWKTATKFDKRPTVAHGNGSIVLKGIGDHEHSKSGSGILWAFTGNLEDDDDDTRAQHTIGNLYLRVDGDTPSILRFTAEMGDATQHGLGNFQNIWVEEGNALVDKSGALGKTKHDNNTLHLAGNGTGDYDGALVLDDPTEDKDQSGKQAFRKDVDWNIVAEADTTVSIKTKDKTLDGTLNAQGHTLTIKTAESITTTLTKAFTAGGGTLDFTGGGNVTLESGFSATDAGTLKVSDGSTVTSKAGNLSGATLNLSDGTFVWGQDSVLSLGGLIGGSGTLQVQFGEGVQLKITGAGQSGVSGDKINLKITGSPTLETFNAEHGGYQLFDTSDGIWNEAWADIFDVTVDAIDPADGVIVVDKSGALVVADEVEGDLYWGDSGSDELVWGGEGEDFHTEQNGQGEESGWQSGIAVHFLSANDAPHDVRLAKNISTGAFEVKGTDPQTQAKFNFQSNDGNLHSLTIKGQDGLRVENAELTFAKDVELTVKNGVSLDETGKVNIAGKATFNGKMVGTGTIAATEQGATISITGAVSEFTGIWNTGTGTITLSEEAAAGNVNATATGSGIFEVKVESGNVAHFNGKVSGTGLTLKNGGVGKLVVTSQNADSGSGTKLDGGAGEGITLGDADNHITWNGIEATGTITLANVTLAGGGLKASEDCAINVDTATASPIALAALRDAAVATPPGGVVDVNGMDAGQLSNITINDGGQLKNVTGTYTADANHKLTLYFSVDNLSATETPAEGKYALIVGKEGGNFKLNADASNKSAVTLDISALAADIITVLSETESNIAPGMAYLHVLQGGTLNMKNLAPEILVGFEQLSAFTKGFSVGDEGGNIKLTGDVGDVFVVPEKLNGAVDAAMLKNMKAVVVGTGRSVSFTTDGDAKLPNVLGGRGSSMTLQKSEKAAGRVTFTFDNSVADVAEVNPPYPEFGGNTVEGMDTTFLGRITADEGVNIAKTGEGTLTVGDNFTVSDGETRIEEGSLRLLGEQNEMKGGLVFAYESDPVEGKERGLLLENGMTEIGGMTDDGSKGAEVKLSGGAELTLSGESTLANTEMIGGEGGGTLYLEKGADLTFTGDKGITGVGVEMEDAVLDLGTSKSTLPALNGTGTLKTAEGGELTVGGGTFTGTLESSGKGAGTLAVVEGATFTLDKVTSSAGMGVRLGAGSTLNVNVGDGTLKFGNVNLGEDGRLKLDYGEKGLDTALVQGNITGWGEEKGTVEFHSDGPVADGPIGTGFTLADGLPTDPETLAKHFKFTGLGNFLKDHHLAVNSKNKEVELTTSEATENKFERAIPGAGKNAHAGAEMLWESLRDITPEAAFFAMFQDPSSDYARLINSLVQCMDTQATAGLDRTFSAAAGSAISTLAPALSQDIHRQLTAIRNRTTTMASDSLTDGYDELPLWHAWLNAEGAYHKLDADGLAPGFTLHNWGGTVGVDVDISRTTTMGLAITAMYGDLEPDSADSASGDMDTYYLSAFARLAHGAWIHTLVVSGGIADVSLNRTVNYGGGSYRTDGSTDGCAFGAMYEVGYTGFVNKRGTVALQPIANVELRHVELSGYTETGSDAGVDADDMDMTVLTLGVGARVQAAVSANAFNRSTVLEGRLLVKTDIGDRSGTVENAIVKHASRAEVESAEVGAVGVEAGIGISIPIDAQSGSIFADASLEWRDNWVSTNATLGYRVNF